MFARISTLFMFLFFALPFLAAASAVPRNDAPPASQCNTGDLQCCNSVQSATDLSSPVTLLLGLLGVVIGDITGLVGVTCSPITVIGGGGTSCTQQPVCCSGNTFGGLISLGCSPVNINL